MLAPWKKSYDKTRQEYETADSTLLTKVHIVKAVCVNHSVVSDSLQPHGTVAHQAPLSMEFFRQEYWSGLPFPSPGDLPDSWIEPWSPAFQVNALPSELLGKPIVKAGY